MASLGSASPAAPPPLVDGLTSITPEGDTLRVREVWASNLEAEMAIIQSVREGEREREKECQPHAARRHFIFPLTSRALSLFHH